MTEVTHVFNFKLDDGDYISTEYSVDTGLTLLSIGVDGVDKLYSSSGSFESQVVDLGDIYTKVDSLNLVCDLPELCTLECSYSDDGETWGDWLKDLQNLPPKRFFKLRLSMVTRFVSASRDVVAVSNSSNIEYDSTYISNTGSRLNVVEDYTKDINSKVDNVTSVILDRSKFKTIGTYSIEVSS